MEPIKRLYTTHEVAKMLGVTPITVIRWIESGKFKCFTTVGGHRRVQHEELVRFAHSQNLPWRGDESFPPRKEYVVLAVDDEPDVLEILKDMLYEVPNLRFIEVSNGFTASAKLVEERPDIILLDFLMPELDGFEFMRFVREDVRFKDIPVIAVTGLKTDADIVKMRHAGVNDILSKPFMMDQLIKKVNLFRSLKNQRKAA